MRQVVRVRPKVCQFDTSLGTSGRPFRRDRQTRAEHALRLNRSLSSIVPVSTPIVSRNHPWRSRCARVSDPALCSTEGLPVRQVLANLRSRERSNRAQAASSASSLSPADSSRLL